MTDDDPVGERAWADAMAFLSGRVAINPRKDRERLVALLSEVGDPHRSLRCVHVAGTNGKGSVTCAVAAILHAVGYRVGGYFSPFVFDVSERWQIDGTGLSRLEIVACLNALRPHVERLARSPYGEVTEFELKTALAFVAFRRADVDFAVLEVGIGGRLDATNVIPPPLVAVITSIGLDHQHLLGDTRAQIAAEKAGIIKTGTLAVVTPVVDDEAGPVINRIAEERRVPVRHVNVDALPEGLSVSGFAPYHRTNLATAACVAEVLRESGVAAIPEVALRLGLENGRLPGRFQAIARGDKTLLLDVAHNPDGAAVLARALGAVFPGRPVHAVVGASRNHDPRPFLAALRPAVQHVVATEPAFRPLPAGAVEDAARALSLPVRSICPASDAIRAAFAATPSGGICLVTGSFFVVGETPRELRTTKSTLEGS